MNIPDFFSNYEAFDLKFLKHVFSLLVVRDCLLAFNLLETGHYYATIHIVVAVATIYISGT